MNLREGDSVFDKKQFAHVFDVDQFKKLVIDLTGTDLVIRQDEHPGIIYYDEKNDHARLELKQDGTTLKIKEKRGLKGLKHSMAFKFMIGKRRLEVSLPKKNFEKLTAKVNSGDVAVSNVTLPELSLTTGSGAVTIAYSKIEQFKMASKDSNLVMKMTDIQKMILDDITGSVMIDQVNLLDNITASINEGDLKMINMEMHDGLITLGSGDVRVRNFKVTGDFKLTTDVGDLSLKAITAPTITIAAVRGNDLENPAVVKGLPMHEQGMAGATFLTTAGHLDVYKDIGISRNED